MSWSMIIKFDWDDQMFTFMRFLDSYFLRTFTSKVSQETLFLFFTYKLKNFESIRLFLGKATAEESERINTVRIRETLFVCFMQLASAFILLFDIYGCLACIQTFIDTNLWFMLITVWLTPTYYRMH